MASNDEQEPAAAAPEFYVEMPDGSEFATFWGKSIETVKSAYPQESVVLDTLTLGFTVEERVDTLVCHPGEHRVHLTKKFLTRFLHATEAQNLIDLTVLSQCCLHEFMHAISFKEISHSKLRLGIETVKPLPNGRIMRENQLANELLTDFFSLELIKRDEYFVGLQDRMGAVVFGDFLVKKAGREALHAAYFKGDMWKLEKALKKNGLNPTLFFALLSSEDIRKVERGFGMVDLKYDREGLKRMLVKM